MTGKRRLILSLVCCLGILAIEAIRVFKTCEGPSIEGMAALSTICTAHYWTDSRTKVARAKAGKDDSASEG